MTLAVMPEDGMVAPKKGDRYRLKKRKWQKIEVEGTEPKTEPLFDVDYTEVKFRYLASQMDGSISLAGFHARFELDTED